jgi:uridine phosphorylase
MPPPDDRFRITHLQMETSGLYGLGRLMGHKTLSVSALLAHRLHGRFCSDPAKVIQHCIQTVLEHLPAGMA